MCVRQGSAHPCHWYFRRWDSSKLLTLFETPLDKRVRQGMGQVAHNLEKHCRGCDWLVLWLDCDREGENIAYEVIDVVRRKAPRVQVFRARFSALIPNDIWNAWNALGVPDPRLSEAVEARTELDLRIGVVFTRFQTLRFRDKFPGLQRKTISYGPCQFPTLGFVVERYLEIQAFVREPFWTIEVEYKQAAASGVPESHGMWHRSAPRACASMSRVHDQPRFLGSATDCSTD